MIRKEVVGFIDIINFNCNQGGSKKVDVSQSEMTILEIYSIEPLTKDEGLLILENLGNREMDDSLNVATGCIVRSEAWPIKNIYYRQEFSDPMNDLKLQLIHDEVPYRFSGQNDWLGDFALSNFDEKVLQLSPTVNLLDMDYLVSYCLLKGDDLSQEVKQHIKIILKKAIKDYEFDYNNHYSETTTDVLKELGVISKNYINTYFNDKNEGYF